MDQSNGQMSCAEKAFLRLKRKHMEESAEARKKGDDGNRMKKRMLKAHNFAYKPQNSRARSGPGESSKSL
jgi:hypothetical protein